MKLNIPAIKKMMANRRMTMTYLAGLTGISKSNLSTIFNRGTCSIKNGGLIADALGVEVEEIWKEE